MKLHIQNKFTDCDILVAGFFEDDLSLSKHHSKDLLLELQQAKKEHLFKGSWGEYYATRINSLPFKIVVALGLGKKKEFNLEKLRKSLGKAVNYVKGKKRTTFTTDIPELGQKILNSLPEMTGRATAESLMLADYDFNKYLSKEKQQNHKPLTDIYLQWTQHTDAFGKGLATGKVIADSTNFVRDLVNEPPKLANSLYMEKIAKSVASSSSKIKIKILNKPELQKLGMNALLGVNAGSDNPPKLIILEYNGGGKEDPIAFVGKGITFDSGGYNLKPTKYIEDMKIDMAGAAAVLGTIKAAAELNIKKNLLGIMAVCENMVDSKALHPGDIVKAYNGKTIEIGNTDAEGRLVLADALAYTEKKYKPQVMIDLATLTGACVVALGYYAAGLVTKDDELANTLKQAGMESGDKVWQLPFFEEYQSWMDGSISDLNNISQKGKGYEGGSITAGVFLSKFVENTKWAHLDIAGSACYGVKNDYLDKGPTGSGVRVLTYYLLSL